MRLFFEETKIISQFQPIEIDHKLEKEAHNLFFLSRTPIFSLKSLDISLSDEEKSSKRYKVPV